MFWNTLNTLRNHLRSFVSLGNRTRFATMGLDCEMSRLVWIDLEMTGLNINTDTIMEIACIVTDTHLNIIAEGPNLVIQTPEEQLAAMNEWCVKQHGKSGLTEAARNSRVTLPEAEETVLEFVKRHVTEKSSPLAGNSVYMDRLFLRKYMPQLDDYLHYRIVDVSSVKELCRRWNYDVYRAMPEKAFDHRALTDIKESIKELQFYRSKFFRTS